MKTSYKLILFFIILIFNCQSKIKKFTIEEFQSSKYFPLERIQKAKYNVKQEGNENSFYDLSLYYGYNEEKNEEFLPYILIMIEKHKKYEYCDLAFIKFLEFYIEDKVSLEAINGDYTQLKLIFEKLNRNQKEFIIYFLKLGNENGNKKCKEYLKRII